MRAASRLFLFLLLAASSVQAEHRGLPLLTVMPQAQHRGGPQMFDVAQDARGLLYVGNLAGLMAYDGAWWRTITLPNGSAVFAVAADRGGLVAAGGIGEFGYVVTAADGSFSYRSLVTQLPPAARDIGEVHGICTAGRGFVFAAENATIEWNGGAPRVIPPLGKPPLACEAIGGVIHLWGEDGMSRLAHGRMVRAGLAGQPIDAAVEGASGAVVAVRDQGLFAVRNGIATPFAPEGTDWLAGKTVTDACRLRDGRLVFTTRENGILILRPDGAVDEILDAVAGLPDGVLSAAAPDREGSLWLAYHGPVARVDLASPVTVLDRRRGINGLGNHVRTLGGRLWMATSLGLFVIDAPGATARRIAGVPSPAWSFVEQRGALLVGTSDGIWRVNDGEPPQRVAGTAGIAAYVFLRSQRDPNLLWVGTRSSLATLRIAGNRLEFAPLAGTPRYVRSLAEKDGVLWAGTIFDGVLRRTPDGAVTKFGSGEMQVAVIGNRVLALKDGSPISTVVNETLIRDPLLGEVDAEHFFAMAEDAAGNVWMNTDPPRVAMRTPRGYSRETRPLTGIGGGVSSISLDEDHAIWFSGSDGFFRFANAPSDNAVPQPPPLLRRVAIGSDEALQSGGIAFLAANPTMRHAFGRLRIEFAPASYRPGVAYQYRLDPIDPAWSEWTTTPFIDYTHLEPGTYTFRIHARGATEAASQETRWTFTVQPPWYRTPSAMVLFVLAGAALIAAIVKLRTTTLRRQAVRLRGQVDERTRELAKTVDLLEQANAHLERLSLLDELTGIPNRRYFDRALAQSCEEAARSQQPVALILLDLDHFKLLNDQRGHPAGDASLVQVARALARKIRRGGDMVTRGGDVVARIGGEEFAILLTDANAETASRVAETLRATIEELTIAFESATLRVTVSCGVAAIDPHTASSPERLIRAADRALYAAKAAGRNCVRGEQAA
jgi:diguanylate cyclase (GGDEF)-like protein